MLSTDQEDEVMALLPGQTTENGPSRRTALQVALGLGYAAAAGPVMAQTAIHTPPDGLTASWIKYKVDGFEVPAYFAAPAGKTGLPVILVVQEIFGVHEYIADVCRRWAQAGYLAIAPQLYARQGDAAKIADAASLMATLVSRVPDAQVLGDLDGALLWASGQGGDVGRAGVTGFCWGGRIAWLYAAQRPAKVQAGVAWYGRLVGNRGPLTPAHPIDVAATLQAPVLGLYGGADTGIPLDTVDEMKVALRHGSPAAKASEFVVYPDTPHAFHADYRPSYREAAAKDSFKRALAWMAQHGVK